MWDNTQMALRDRLSDLSLEQRRALCAAIMTAGQGQMIGGIEVVDAQFSAEQIISLLQNSSADCKEMLKRLIGSCNGSCNQNPNTRAGCYNRRISVLEEDRLRSDIGGAIDIPTVAGAGGVQAVTVPIYGVEYFLTQFSMDGEIAVATGSLTRVEIVVSHAGFPLATFRASQYTKASCCTTIAEAFRRKNLCLGWNSTFTITVTNNNVLVAESFVNGVFSYIRGYPDPNTGF
jgi:hypothetical protein